MKKFFRYLFITLIVIVALVIGAGFIIANYYEDNIKNYAVNELNKYISSKIDVSEIHFSVLKKFPDASLEFTNVVAYSTSDFSKKGFTGNTDKFFSAERLFLQFNVIDIFKENYEIKTIRVENGEANILIDKKGNDNFHFWKESETGEETNFNLKLENIQLADMNVTFENLAQNIYLKSHTDSYNLNGDFSSDSYTLSTKGAVSIENLAFNNVNYISSRDLTAKFSLDVDNNSYKIKNGKIYIADLVFDTQGDVTVNDITNINIQVEGKDISIESALSLVPDEYKEYTKGYNSSGNFYFKASVKGEVDAIKTPHIETEFGVIGGTIDKNAANLKLTDVNLEGKFSNGKYNNSASSSIKIDNFNALFGENSVNGNFVMENFIHPNVLLSANAKINLIDLQEFLQIDTIETIEGAVETSIRFNGRLNKLGEITTTDLRYAKTEGKLSLINGYLSLDESPYRYSDINGDFTFKNNDLKIDALSLKMGDNDFSLYGYLNNFLSYILVDNQKLVADLNVKSNKLKLDDLIYAGNDNSTSNEEFIFPDNVMFKGTLHIDDFSFEKFVAKNVDASINYRDSKLTANNLSFNTMEGSIKGSGEIRQNESKNHIIQTNATLENIDVQKLFNTFNGFSQDFIREEHLRGKISADILFSSEWTNDFEIIPEKIVSESNLEINDGELIDFEPLESLSDFISINELRHIKFSKLKNRIQIKNQKVTIPEMDINSSAINIGIYGEHLFNNDILYKFKVSLSDVLSKKAKRANKDNEDFGEIEDDGLGRIKIPIKIFGNISDYKIAYDTKKVKENIKENVDKEKATLKEILNEEYGWFGNDTTVTNNVDKKDKDDDKDQQIRVVWDEEDSGIEDLSDEEDD